MNRSALLSSAATSFSHLVGRGPKASRRAAEETDEDKKKREEDEAARKAEDDEDDKKADGKPDDQGENETDEEYRERKKREEEDADDDDEKDDDEDEDDERDKKDAKASAARARERARCKAIFASQHAAGRVEFAAHLAFNTKTGRRAAIAMLKASPKAAEGGLAGRMQGMESLRPGADAPRPTERQARQSSWDQAATRIGVKSR